MGYRPIKDFLRRYIQHPAIYGYARRVLLLFQYLARTPDEPDFAVFRQFDHLNGNLLVDVGANGGQSAIAFAFMCPKSEILSFEPNPALWSDLNFVRRVLGKRFSYRKLGLGRSAATMRLHIPVVGNLPITTRASLSLEDAEEHRLRLKGELKREIGMRAVDVDVVAFDELGLRPYAIKIDVEGFELDVLNGMHATIAACSPLLMLESNESDAACKEFLASYGYEFFDFDQTTGKLSDKPVTKTRNWFAVPRDLVATALTQ